MIGGFLCAKEYGELNDLLAQYGGDFFAVVSSWNTMRRTWL
jgi:hypothetical protein